MPAAMKRPTARSISAATKEWRRRCFARGELSVNLDLAAAGSESSRGQDEQAATGEPDGRRGAVLVARGHGTEAGLRTAGCAAGVTATGRARVVVVAVLAGIARRSDGQRDGDDADREPASA